MKLDFRFIGITLSMLIIIIFAIKYNKEINKFNSTYLRITNDLHQLKHNIFEQQNNINQIKINLYFNNDQISTNFKNFKNIEQLMLSDINLKENYPQIYKEVSSILDQQAKILEDSNEYIKKNSSVKNSLSILYKRISINNNYDDIYYENLMEFLLSALYQRNNFINDFHRKDTLFKYFEKTKENTRDHRINFLHISILNKEIPILENLSSKIKKKILLDKINKLILNFEEKSTIYKKKIQRNFFVVLAGTIIFFSIILILIRNIKNHVENLRHKDKLIYNQSKHAAMGEMIDAIAHQWQQPINILKMRTELLTVLKDEGEGVTRQEIDEYQKKVDEQLDHMVSTLNEFRSFLRPNKGTKLFSVEKSIRGVLILLKDELIKSQITAKLIVKNDFDIDGVENEFKHVLINLLNNSKDAFIEHKIEKRSIQITIDKNKLFIQDNAGGIPPILLKRIFEANFTTKKEGEGTGIGLYMTKQILDKIDTTIEAKNTDDGVCFIISLNKLSNRT